MFVFIVGVMLYCLGIPFMVYGPIRRDKTMLWGGVAIVILGLFLTAPYLLTVILPEIF